MDYPLCFNTYNNINSRQRSQTLQPIRGRALAELPNYKEFILDKYFTSQINSIDSERANYANVPPDGPDETMVVHNQNHDHHYHQHSNPSRTHRQQLHNRSHSQHYYHTTCQTGPNDLNNYYNLSNVGANTIIPARSRIPSPINEPQHQSMHHQQYQNHNHHHRHNQVAQLDCIAILQVCSVLGNLDATPPIPAPRNYSISGSKDCGLYKIMFPHDRIMRNHFVDPITGVCLAPGNAISVLGPSKSDRSKFAVCFNDRHMDMPHILTHPPQWT